MKNMVDEQQAGMPATAHGRLGTRVIAVTSGKGGVGKTNVVANLAVELARLGKRVLVLDADLGLGNIDILLGLVPRYTLEHVLCGSHRLSDIIIPGPAGIQVLPAGSGLSQLTSLTDSQQLILQTELEEIADAVEVLLIDTGAGISPNVTYFASAAQETVVVISPEPTSLTDAYALMKVLCRQYRERRFHVLVNMVKSQHEATQSFRKLDAAAERFLHINLDYLGFIPLDDYLPMAVIEQKAVTERFPRSSVSRAFVQLAKKIAAWPDPQLPKSTVQFLWQQLIPMS
ncbi:MAG: MinD/ParA family protein [Nitrospirota bacterium]|nr:MinD/ParA family protein [Nitrospirota bacterium]